MMVPIPLWMAAVVRARPCPSCQRPIELNDIAGVLTRLVQGGKPNARPRAGPITWVLVHCTCGETSLFLAAADKQQVHAGVDCVFRFAAEARRRGADRHDDNLALEPPVGTCDDGCGDGGKPRKGRRMPLLGPSRGACPKTPITDAEVQTFLRRLKRASFKRSSRSFKGLMKAWGYNIGDPHRGPSAPPGASEPPEPPPADDDPPPF